MNSSINKDGDVVVLPKVVSEFQGSQKPEALLTKSHLAPHPVEMESVIVGSCEQDSFIGANIWSYPSNDHQKIIVNDNIHRMIVRDVLFINAEYNNTTPTLISCLTDDTVKLYKIS